MRKKATRNRKGCPLCKSYKRAGNDLALRKPASELRKLSAKYGMRKVLEGLIDNLQHTLDEYEARYG